MLRPEGPRGLLACSARRAARNARTQSRAQVTASGNERWFARLACLARARFATPAGRNLSARTQRAHGPAGCANGSPAVGGRLKGTARMPSRFAAVASKAVPAVYQGHHRAGAPKAPTSRRAATNARRNQVPAHQKPGLRPHVGLRALGVALAAPEPRRARHPQPAAGPAPRECPVQSPRAVPYWLKPLAWLGGVRRAAAGLGLQSPFGLGTRRGSA